MDNKNNEQKKEPVKKAFNKKKKYYKPKQKTVKVTKIEEKSNIDESVNITKEFTSVNVIEKSKQEKSIDLTSDVKSEMVEKSVEEKVVDLTFQSETAQVEEAKQEESKIVTEKSKILVPNDELPIGVYNVNEKEVKKEVETSFFKKIINKIKSCFM
jgi:hypothetical protein